MKHIMRYETKLDICIYNDYNYTYMDHIKHVYIILSTQS